MKFTVAPGAYVVEVPVIVSVAVPLVPGVITMKPGPPLALRLANVWFVTVEFLPWMINVPPPKTRLELPLTKFVGVLILLKSSLSVPPLIVVFPV